MFASACRSVAKCAIAGAWTAIVVTCASAAIASASPVLGYDDARHLLARTGFGPTDAEIRAFAPLRRDEAVAKLLRKSRRVAVTPPPAAMLESAPLRPEGGEHATSEQRIAFVRHQAVRTAELRDWWIREMLATPSPLTERMTLFWHNHFVSSQQKVRTALLVYRQNVLLREHAIGRFDALLRAIARDPAMLVYLDGARNRKGAANENFARELMELFTLGEGHYSEADVKDAARAFTGWSLDRDSGEFRFRPMLHDRGIKTVLGRTGRLDGDDVLDILLARPQTAELIVAKLWREFVSPDVDARAVTAIAIRFRESGYDVKIALGDLLTSDAFYAAENRGTLVKSPIDFVVGTLRQLDVAPREGLPFAIAAAGMGQTLFAPPNVKGWPGGEAWINAQTLLARKQFAERLTRAREMPRDFQVRYDPTRMSSDPVAAVTTRGADTSRNGDALRRRVARGVAELDFDAERFLASLGPNADERGRWAQRLLLAVPPVKPLDADADATSVLRQLMLDAAYQVK